MPELVVKQRWDRNYGLITNSGACPTPPTTDPLPLARSHTPKVPQLPKAMTLFGDRVFKHTTLQDAFSHPNHTIASTSGTIPYKHISMQGRRDNSNQASSTYSLCFSSSTYLNLNLFNNSFHIFLLKHQCHVSTRTSP